MNTSPQFLPFQGSRRNSLEQSIWAPMPSERQVDSSAHRASLQPRQGSLDQGLTFAPGLWDPWRPPELPQWVSARRHLVGDVFPGNQQHQQHQHQQHHLHPPGLQHQQLQSMPPFGWPGHLHHSEQPHGFSGQAFLNYVPRSANPPQNHSSPTNVQSSPKENKELPVSAPAAQQHPETSAVDSVDAYFSADPHQRVKVTAEYLSQRFFDEEKYLLDLYQLPKFPVESQLHDAQLVLVAFKAGRIDVFYLPSSLTQPIGVGDLVMVEADRGRDLGKIVKMNISIDEARLLKLLQFLEQQAALCDTSVGDLLVRLLHGAPHGGPAPPTLHFPKPIIGLAQHSETVQILNKKQDEEKACRLCLAKIASTSSALDKNSLSLLSLLDLNQMKLVDAEYQFDRKKLIFYYSTSRRIDFRDLVRELFRIYKTRIWMCAVNGIPYKRRQSQSKAQAQTLNSPPGLSTMSQESYSQAAGGKPRSQSQSSPQGRPYANVPRNLMRQPEENGEGFVLKLLVDTLNH